MGMYTEIGVNAPITEEAQEAIALISFGILPTNTARADIIWEDARVDEGRLEIHATLKNYDDDCQRVIEWVRSHLDPSRCDDLDGIIAATWYEEDLLPTFWKARS